jgi:hypothetical protein
VGDVVGKTASSLADICNNPKWYDFINPFILSTCAAYNWTGVQLEKPADLPVAPSPSVQPPPAPQTGAMMRGGWTPPVAEESTAQRGVQYGLDTQYFRGLLDESAGGSGGGGSAYVPYDESKEGGSSWWTWALLGTAIVGGVWIAGGRR